MYPIFVIDNQIKRFLEMQYTIISNENTVNNNKKIYFKLPYIGTFSNATKIKLNQICDKYCENTNIAVAFSPLKIGSFFSCKDSILKFIQSYVVYQFTCARCNAFYIGETKRHLKTRIEEYLGKGKNSQKHKSIYELDPAKFLSAPGLAWSCLPKKLKTKVQLDLLIDIDMLLMVEKGIRGGICHSMYRYEKANNKYMKD